MKFKKVMSAIMAGAMVLSLGMTAFASSEPNKEDAEDFALEVESVTKVPAMKLIVPERAIMVVNPYRLEVDLAEFEAGTDKKSTQVVSPTQYIQNLGDITVAVNGKVTGVCSESVSFAAAKPADPKKKDAFIKLQLAKVADATTAIPSSGTTDVTLSTTETALAGTAFELDPKSKTGGTPCLAFAFTGEVQDAPETPWTEDDVFGATIVFNFVAKANAAPTP